MRSEKQQLIHDLLGDESRRDATLRAGATVLRRRRHWRAARQTLAVLVLGTAAALLILQQRPHPRPLQASAAPAKPSASPLAQSLTDDQLLALFPNTPVGLATLPNGRKLLIFPRPGDAAKFITRL